MFPFFRERAKIENEIIFTQEEIATIKAKRNLDKMKEKTKEEK